MTLQDKFKMNVGAGLVHDGHCGAKTEEKFKCEYRMAFQPPALSSMSLCPAALAARKNYERLAEQFADEMPTNPSRQTMHSHRFDRSDPFGPLMPFPAVTPMPRFPYPDGLDDQTGSDFHGRKALLSNAAESAWDDEEAITHVLRTLEPPSAV